MEAKLFGADHEMLAGAIATMIHGFAVAATGGDAGENRDQKEQ